MVWIEHLDRKGKVVEADGNQAVEIAADSWAEKVVNENIVKWGHAKMCLMFGADSLTKVDPAVIYNWAFKKGVLNILPAAFKKDDVISRAHMFSDGGSK